MQAGNVIGIMAAVAAMLLALGLAAVAAAAITHAGEAMGDWERRGGNGSKGA